MLNVVNFGGGAYVIYAEVLPSGEIEVDPEPYSDTFDRPARLLPIEAKALVAAIDLLNLAQPELSTAREKVVEALGHDPVEEGLQITSPTVADEVAHTVERAVHESRLLELEYWSPSSASRSAASSRTRSSTAPRRGTSRPTTSTRTGSSTSGSTASRAPPRSTSTSSAARTSTRSPTSAAGRAPARSRARASPASGSRPSRRAGRARSARWSPSSRTARSSSSSRSRASTSSSRRSSRRRATPRCSSPPTPARPCWPPPSGCSHQFVSRAAVAMTADEVAAFLDEQRIAHVRDDRPRRLAAPDAALVRRPRRRGLVLDLREVPEGPQPRA